MQEKQGRELHHVPAFVCSHVLNKTRPVLSVLHAEGEWQLVCGADHYDGPELVGLNHLVADDPTLREILDLPLDYEAERDAVGAPWSRQPAAEREE